MDIEVPGLDEAIAVAQHLPTREIRPLLAKGLSHFHEALADYLLVKPEATYREMGAYFTYSPAWLCTVVKSDMFQSYFATRRAQVSALVNGSIPAKLELAGHLVVERLIEVIPMMEDSKQIVDTFDTVMHRLGYAPASKAPVGVVPQNVQNNFYLSKDDLKEVKGVLLDHHAPGPAAALTLDLVEVPAEPQLPAPK